MSPRIFRAPGRVNLIGDHTDYQDGFVMPMALQLETRVTAELGGPRVRLQSQSFPERVDIAADGSDGPTGGVEGWGRYVAGVVWALAQAGRPAVGIEGSVASTVPVGAGLSSSAALEVALAMALCASAGWAVPPLELAKACRYGEMEGAGVPCGIMDQAVAILGSPHGALLLDCRSLDYEYVPVPQSHNVVIVDSGVPRHLAASKYAERIRETNAGVYAIKQDHPDVRALRDAALPMLEGLPTVLQSRCRHVVTENARVLETARALRSNSVERVAHVFEASHRSNQRDFEASHPEVDALVERLRAMEGVVGARITGGGFGGVVVAIVTTPQARNVLDAVQPKRAWIALPSPGAGEVSA